jgi:diguanylate cyclase (GGDEF)-like protein
MKREARSDPGWTLFGSVRRTDPLARYGLKAQSLSPKVRAGFDQLLAENALLRVDLTDLSEKLVAAEALADYDALTPVRNRRAFLREVDRAIGHCARYGGQASVLFLDLDGFKAVNDRHGHAAGDAALTHVASLLLGQVRGTDVVGRIGGDEFAVLLAKASLEEARAKAHALSLLIAASPAVFEGVSLSIGASIGAAAFDGKTGETPNAILARADEAMFLEKASAKARG